MSTSLRGRLAALYVGLGLFGASIALMIRADLGLSSWDVLHQGLAQRSGLPFGWVVIGISALVMVAWLPLRQRPGLGTVRNVILVGPAVDATLWILPAPSHLAIRAALLVAGIGLNGVATCLYIEPAGRASQTRDPATHPQPSI